MVNAAKNKKNFFIVVYFRAIAVPELLYSFKPAIVTEIIRGTHGKTIES
jgi:hypothetical protein